VGAGPPLSTQLLPSARIGQLCTTPQGIGGHQPDKLDDVDLRRDHGDQRAVGAEQAAHELDVNVDLLALDHDGRGVQGSLARGAAPHEFYAREAHAVLVQEHREVVVELGREVGRRVREREVAGLRRGCEDLDGGGGGGGAGTTAGTRGWKEREGCFFGGCGGGDGGRSGGGLDGGVVSVLFVVLCFLRVRGHDMVKSIVTEGQVKRRQGRSYKLSPPGGGVSVIEERLFGPMWAELNHVRGLATSRRVCADDPIARKRSHG
jgi:hypothetical protein